MSDSTKTLILTKDLVEITDLVKLVKEGCASLSGIGVNARSKEATLLENTLDVVLSKCQKLVDTTGKKSYADSKAAAEKDATSTAAPSPSSPSTDSLPTFGAAPSPSSPSPGTDLTALTDQIPTESIATVGAATSPSLPSPGTDLTALTDQIPTESIATVGAATSPSLPSPGTDLTALTAQPLALGLSHESTPTLRRWTDDDHRKLLIGVKWYNWGNWKAISENVLETRSQKAIEAYARNIGKGELMRQLHEVYNDLPDRPSGSTPAPRFWTDVENRKLLIGLKWFGEDWNKIALNLITKRTPHAIYKRTRRIGKGELMRQLHEVYNDLPDRPTNASLETELPHPADQLHAESIATFGASTSPSSSTTNSLPPLADQIPTESIATFGASTSPSSSTTNSLPPLADQIPTESIATFGASTSPSLQSASASMTPSNLQTHTVQHNEPSYTFDWTRDEQAIFSKALEEHNNDMEKVIECITTRSRIQVLLHARKHFQQSNNNNCVSQIDGMLRDDEEFVKDVLSDWGDGADSDTILKRSNTYNAVYRITCNCCGMIYIGSTKRTVRERLYDHTNRGPVRRHFTEFHNVSESYMILNKMKKQILWASPSSNAIQSSDGGEENCMLCTKEYQYIHTYFQKYGLENMMNTDILQNRSSCPHNYSSILKKKRKAGEISNIAAV